MKDTNDGRDDFFETYRENAFYFREEEIHTNEFDIIDIAHALSMCCRYNGHVLRFYSVAEHCCLLHDFVMNQYGTTAYDGYDGWTNRVALQLLMHDASEAFMSDMPAPMKRFLPDLKHMESYIEKAIFAYYNIPMPGAFVKDLDSRIIIDEREQAMGSTGKFEWFYEPLYMQPLGVDLHFWEPEQARDEFLTRFHSTKAAYDKREKRK